MAQPSSFAAAVGLTTAIDCFGDSLTQGAGGNGVTITTQLGIRFPGRQINNWGIGGQTSTQIASRQGGVPLSLSVSGNSLPWSNAATALTAISSSLLSTAADSFARYITGHINGIPAYLERTTSDTYNVYAATTAVTALASSVPFVSDDGWNARHSTQVLWMGTNDDVTQTGVAAAVLATIAKCVAYMNDPKRAIVVGLHPTPSQVRGTSPFTLIDAFNQSLAAAYPSYVSSQGPTAAECAAVGYTPNTADLAQMANGVWPFGLTAGNIDTVHLTGQGYQIVGNRIADMIAAMGW